MGPMGPMGHMGPWAHGAMGHGPILNKKTKQKERIVCFLSKNRIYVISKCVFYQKKTSKSISNQLK
jgi:hypothetical protein